MAKFSQYGSELNGFYHALVVDSESILPRHSFRELEEELHLSGGFLGYRDPANLFLAAITIFPRVGKWFDRVLCVDADDFGPLRAEERQLRASIKEIASLERLPFLDSMFGVDGPLPYLLEHGHESVDENWILLARQMLYFYKKFTVACPDEKVYSSVGEFIEIDEYLRSPRSLDTGLFFEVRSGPFTMVYWAENPEAFNERSDYLTYLPVSSPAGWVQ